MSESTLTGMIEELRSRKKRLEAAIASLEAVDNTNGARIRPTNGQKRQTIMGTILAHLKKVGQDQTSGELREAIWAAGVQATESSIQTLMSRRAKLRKDLIRLGRGKWGLKR